MIKIKIWSDVLCPYCYIGKRHLEQALSRFESRNAVEIEWKSFELDPHARKARSGSIYELLAAKYGQSEQWARTMTERMTEMAANSGLRFDFARSIPTNSLDAHRLIQLAKKHGLQDAAEEKLFAAYLSEGRDISDHDTLTQLGTEIGLPQDETREMLASERYTAEVRQDEQEAALLGIRGVPFFVFNEKYAVSGAQPVDVFLDALRNLTQSRDEATSGESR